MKKRIMIGVCMAAITACTHIPVPLTETEIAENAQNLQASLTQSTQTNYGDIDLYDAMAYALKYNLDHRISMMEADLAQQDYKLARYDLLPQVVANAGYYGRNNNAGASSQSLIGNQQQSLVPSRSTERDVFSADLRVSWNILDFGLSKIRAKQLGHEYLIYEERRRKAVIDLMEEVHSAYWRALSAQRLNDSLHALESEVSMAFGDAQKLYVNRKTAPISALSYQRELNLVQKQAQNLHRQLSLAKSDLARTMNLPVRAVFNVKPLANKNEVPELSISFEDMAHAALRARPEIREAQYTLKISKSEITKTVLEALPSLDVYSGLNVNSNDFLFNHNWVSYGAKASWDVLRLLQAPTRRLRAEARVILEKERALAIARAVLAQVNISRIRYHTLREQYLTLQTGAKIQEEILSHVKAQTRSRATGRQNLVREKMNMLITKAELDTIHAELRGAQAQIYTAMGHDPYDSDVTGAEDVESLAASLRRLWEARSDMGASINTSQSN